MMKFIRNHNYSLALLAIILVAASSLPAGAESLQDANSAAEQAAQRAGLDPGMLQTIKSALPEAQQLSSQAIEWLPISQAPQMPVPLFTGSDTKFLKTATPKFLQGVQADLSQITIQTSDSAGSVSTWYKQRLPQTGFVLEQPGKPAAKPAYAVRTSKGETLRAASDSANCSISIQSLRSNPPLSLIYVNAIKKGRIK